MVDSTSASATTSVERATARYSWPRGTSEAEWHAGWTRGPDQLTNASPRQCLSDGADPAEYHGLAGWDSRPFAATVQFSMRVR